MTRAETRLLVAASIAGGIATQRPTLYQSERGEIATRALGIADKLIALAGKHPPGKVPSR